MGSSMGSTMAVLIQKMPSSSAEEKTNQVYVVQMGSSDFENYMAEAQIAPDKGSGDALDVDEIARQVFDDVKERLAFDRERMQPMA